MSVLAPGEVVGDTYRVLRRVGAGAMGQVYEATHARLAGRYAIKVMQPEVAAHPAALERFRREAQITSSLRHPNIVHIMDFNQLADGSPYLVMEFLEGLDLGTHLMRTGPPPLEEVVVLVGQIASALEAAHGRGVVHRDLKPANICLVPLPGQASSVVKVVDFGMSKMRTTQPLTGERALIGTAAYMSPEQAVGKVDDIDHRTDQFALAVIAYQMLSGRDAFAGDSEPALLYHIVHSQPAPLDLAHPATPSRRDALAAVLGRALDKDKTRRYPSILEFAQAFDDASGMVRASRRARSIFDARAGIASAPVTPAHSFALTALDAAPPRGMSAGASDPGGARAAPASSGAQSAPAAAASAPVSARVVKTEPAPSNERRARGRRVVRWSLVGVAGLLAVAVGGGVWRSSARTVPQAKVSVATPEPAATPPAVSPTPASVTLVIEGLPANAMTYWDQQPARFPMTLAPDPRPHRLRIEAAGWAPYDGDLVADRDRTITIMLARPAEPAPARTRRARTRRVPPDRAPTSASPSE